MRKASLLLIASLLVPSLAHASARASTGRQNNARAKDIVTAMLAALHRQQHIGAKGTVRGPGKGITTYRLRYQPEGREDYLIRGGSTAVNSRQKNSPGLHYIFIGKVEYTTVNGTRWFRLRSTAAPDAADSLSINTNGAPCCLAGGIRPGETVKFKGTFKWHGRNAYVLSYRGASSLGGAYGKVYVDPGSSLPVGYTATTAPRKAKGSFTITYNGTFNIAAPKM